jgi:hypothetical protein
MNEHPKISAPTTPLQPTSYIKLEMWVKEADFDDVYEALNDVGRRSNKFVLRMLHKEWDSTSTVIRGSSRISR